jgi:hypothetical protein
MAFRTFKKQVDQDRFFVAEEKITPEMRAWPYPRNIDNDQQLKAFVQDRFSRAYTGMIPELAKMRMIERLYAGHHYLSPHDNFNNEITNYAFSVVETVWPELVSERPRPIIVPRGGTRAAFERIKKHQKIASWAMDVTGFDDWRRRSMRAKLKFGTNITVLLPHPATGLAYPTHWSNWHFFPDPGATKPQNLMYYFLAGPAPVPMVKAVFGKSADGLKADNYVSPGWRVLVQNYYDLYTHRDMDGSASVPWVTSSVNSDSNPQQLTGDAWLVPMSGERSPGADTSFLVQMFFRDLTKMAVAYQGMMHHRQPDGTYIRYPAIMPDEDYVCDGGWRVCSLAGSDGRVLQCAPLDEAWGGMNMVMGWDYQHEDRLFGYGEIEQIAPKIRAINRSYYLIGQAEAYETLPIVVKDQASAADTNRAEFGPGDTITKRQNTEVKILEFRGIGNVLFNLLQERKSDFHDVSGVTPAQEGQRPPGIEAAAAYRAILAQALKRTQGKIPMYLDEMSTIVKKMMVYLSKKLDTALGIMAADGEPLSIEPGEFEYEFDLRFDASTASLGGKMLAEDKLLQLAQLGIVDQQYVIEQMELPGANELMERMAAREQQEAEIRLVEALMAGQGQGNGKSGGGGSSARASSNGERREMSRSRAQTRE